MQGGRATTCRIMRQTTGGTTRGKPDWKGGGPPLGAWRCSTYRPDGTHAKGGPPPLASHRGIGMPSQRVWKHEVDQGGTSPLVSQTDMKEDHQVTVGSVEHTIQTRRRARGSTTLSWRRKGRRPGGSRTDDGLCGSVFKGGDRRCEVVVVVFCSRQNVLWEVPAGSTLGAHMVSHG